MLASLLAAFRFPGPRPRQHPGVQPADLARPVGRNGQSADSAYESGAVLDRTNDTGAADDTGELIVRDKTHAADAMSTTQALHEMELIGHDFYLFADSETGQPSVVYRRHGYDYGVIRLATA